MLWCGPLLFLSPTIRDRSRCDQLVARGCTVYHRRLIGDIGFVCIIVHDSSRQTHQSSLFCAASPHQLCDYHRPDIPHILLLIESIRFYIGTHIEKGILGGLAKHIWPRVTL